MSLAHQAAIRRRARRGLSRLTRRRRCGPLLSKPWPLVAYLLTVVGGDVGLVGWQLARTAPEAGQILLFAALLACAAVCIEATRRLGMPAGVSRDLMSAWWLPVALLLPPLYALLAPVPIGLLLQLRVRRAPVFRRAFSVAVLRIAGATASGAFGLLGALIAGDTPRSRPNAWLTYPTMVVAAVACAMLFTVVNMAMVAVAAYMADRQTPRRERLWDREGLLLDVAEMCVGVLVTISCVANVGCCSLPCRR